MLRTLSRVEVTERMTSEEFFRYAPNDKKVELIDGVIIVSPPPMDSHERLQIFLLRLLGEFVELFDLGEIRGSRTAVVLADDQVYEPDILFVIRERVGIIEDRGVFGAPDLVVEILSASTVAHDRGTKFHTYQKAGVRELWLIDPYGPVGTEFYQRQGNLFKPIMPDENGIIQAVALPNFKLNTAWLWPVEKFISVRSALREMGVGS
jgi:Uma2 family endonuclease